MEKSARLTGAGAGLFAIVALLMATGAGQSADHALLLLLRDAGDGGTPHAPPWLVEAIIDVTALGGYPVIITWMVAACAILVAAGNGRYAGFLLASIASGTLAAHLLKLLFARERPDLVVPLLDTHTASFPSSHAAMSAIFYLALGFVLSRLTPVYRARLAIVAVGLALTFMVGISRVYLGVHWPSDVLAGWAVAAACLGLCMMIFIWAEGRSNADAGQRPP